MTLLKLAFASVHRILCCAVGVALALVQAPAQTSCVSTHTEELFPQHAGAGDYIGESLAMNAVGDRLAIGSGWHDHAAVNDGCVYVISDLGTPAQSEIELRPSMGGENSVFGTSVAINLVGDVLVVGAPGVNFAAGFKGMFVFRFDGTNWNEEWHTPQLYSDGFGEDVAIDAAGEVIAVGAQQRLGLYGYPVGAVDIFRHQAGGWIREAMVRPADIQMFDRFGITIALSASGNLLAVQSGSQFPVPNGAVYLFERVAGVWTQVAKIQETVAHSLGNFGASIALSASEQAIAIGSPFDWRLGYNAGAVMLYRKPGSNWVLDHEFFGTGQGPNDTFGYSVAMSAAGDHVWAGAIGQMHQTLMSGAVYEFSRDNGSWPLQARHFQPNPTHDASFGRALCADAAGDRWAASEPFTDQYALNAGLVHLYDSSCSSPVVYCTAKTNSLGCVPQIAAQGTPSVSSPSGFVVSVSNTRNQREGLLCYSTNGRASLPWRGGTLCVQPPLMRTSFQNSGGSSAPANDCSGTLARDFNAWTATGRDPALVAGQLVRAQFYSLDPGPGFQVNLSDAVEFVLLP